MYALCRKERQAKPKLRLPFFVSDMYYINQKFSNSPQKQNSPNFFPTVKKFKLFRLGAENGT